MRRALRIGVQVAVTVGLVAAGVAYLWSHRADVARLLSGLGPATLALSLSTATAGTVLGGLAWRRVLVALGVRLDRRSALTVFLSSQLGKYLPGGFGPVLAQASWSRQVGTRPATVVGSYVLTFLLSFAAATLGGGLLLSYRWPLGGGLVAAGGLVLTALLVTRGGTRLLSAVLGKVAPRRGLVLPYGRDWRAAYALSVAGWLLVGCHVGILVYGHHHALADALAATGAIMAAAALGAAAIVVPGGMGVREGGLFWALTVIVPSAPALDISLTSRMMTLLVDVGLGLAATVLLPSLLRLAGEQVRCGQWVEPPLPAPHASPRVDVAASGRPHR